MDFSGYLRQARALPLQVVLRKAVGLARRTGGSWAQLASDALGGSYGAARPAINPAACIVIAADDVPADLEATLRRLAPEYLAHRLDLLGSGWVSPVYGLSANGFLGHRYAPTGPAAPDRAGHGLEAIVNRSNLAPSRRIWRMIARENYTPIDWQLDVRSGYRWSAQRPSLRLPIPVDIGADVKMPWELGRLQHLPQLALCAILAAAGRQGFDAPARYAGEIADQLADFIAANPPRFGVNWMGAMDVGIRAANIALTLALLRGAGFELSPDLQETVAGALNDHAEHVVTHLEYSESGRSNHYLANLGGVLWASWALTGEDAERRLIFAIAEVLKEADHQFLADGGNYEGSTSYHRLSAEIVLFSLAVIVSLDDAALARLERKARMQWEALHPPTDPLRVAARQAFRGPREPRKADTLGRYTFALCFENSALEGCIPEKIFDCFYAGTVPIYWGAPDIERWIPRECFVDMREFESYTELRDFLRSRSPDHVEGYRVAAREFLRSEQFRPFSKRTFAERIGRMVEEDAGVRL